MKNKTQPTQLAESLDEALKRVDTDIDDGKYNNQEPESEVLSEADQLKLDCLKAGIKNTEIPYRFDMLIDRDKEIAQIKHFIKRVFDEDTEMPLGLVLHGSVGTGKTHALVCIAKEFIKKYKPFRCRYVKADDMFLDIIDFSDKSVSMQEKIAYYRGVSFLFIDDIGNGNLSDAEKKNIMRIVDSRQRNGEMTIFTSNRDNLGLQKVVGIAEASRFKLYEQIEFSGIDHRNNLKKV